MLKVGIEGGINKEGVTYHTSQNELRMFVSKKKQENTIAIC